MPHRLNIKSDSEPRRRSSSIIGHLPTETIIEQSDQAASPNMNASWVHNKGAWMVHLVIVAALLLLFELMPFVSKELVWTLTAIVYNTGFYIMFHYVTGAPMDFSVNAGAYDGLTMWEQVDNGDQYTPTKKFLLGVPIGLFLISTHFTHYDLKLFLVNIGICIFSVLPKLPSSHRLRLMPDLPPTPNSSETHLPRSSACLESPRR